jgi:hypothetical protein
MHQRRELASPPTTPRTVIVAQARTEATVDDAAVAIQLIGAAAGDIASVTADAAYETVAFYEAAGARHAHVVVPPTRTAKASRRGPRSDARDPVIGDVETLGRVRSTTWKCSGVANAGKPRATTGKPVWRTRSSVTNPSLEMAFATAADGPGRRIESGPWCLDRMTALDTPDSSAISSVKKPWSAELRAHCRAMHQRCARVRP